MIKYTAGSKKYKLKRNPDHTKETVGIRNKRQRKGPEGQVE